MSISYLIIFYSSHYCYRYADICLLLQGKEKQYKGPFNTIRIVLETGGLRNLYKGLSPALLRQVSTTSYLFTVFDPLSNKDRRIMTKIKRIVSYADMSEILEKIRKFYV